MATFMMRCGESALIRFRVENIEWRPTEADRKRAGRNHGQTLERLNERGGMLWCEMAAILEDRSWRWMDQKAAREAVYAELKRRAVIAPEAEALSIVILAWQKRFGITAMGAIHRDTLARAILDAGYGPPDKQGGGN